MTRYRIDASFFIEAESAEGARDKAQQAIDDLGADDVILDVLDSHTLQPHSVGHGMAVR